MSKRIWLIAAAIAACTDVHGPQEGTQTGNPPVLDRGKVTLEVSADEVHVTGEPGAAAPGGATIEITNLTTGKVIVGKAAPDGSFDVRVDGSLDDAFVVRAVANGQESPPVYVVRGGAVIPGEDDGSLRCDQYYELARAVIDASAAKADRSCGSASDCTMATLYASCAAACDVAYVTNTGAQQIAASIASLNAGLCALWTTEDRCSLAFVDCSPHARPDCVAGQCMPRGALSCDERRTEAAGTLSAALTEAGTSCEIDSDCVEVSVAVTCIGGCGNTEIVPRLGKAVVEYAVAEINAEVCPNFRADGCPVQQVLIPCLAEILPPPSCEAGRCTRKSDVSPMPDGGIPDCTTCFTESLKWGWEGPFAPYVDLSGLAPCAHYVHRRSPAGDPSVGDHSCERDLVACNSIASTGAVMSALGQADVQRAFSERARFGSFPPDGGSFLVTYGDLSIEVGGSCEGAPPTCVPPPPGVAALVQLLADIDDAMLMTEECADFPR